MQQVTSADRPGNRNGPRPSIPEQMVGLVKHAATGAMLESVPVPPIGPTDVLVRVEAASICGTDLHIYRWDEWARKRVQAPMVFGHEFCGEVVAAGSEASRVPVGTYVSAETHIACGECYECLHGLQHICKQVEIIGVDRPGAFAQFIAVPERNLWPTDRRFQPQIATIQEPMGNAVHSALSAPIAGASVAIFGAGPIGLFTVPIARATGAARILTVEPSAYRRQLATQVGSDVVIDPGNEDVVARLLDETQGEGVDVVLEMSGNPGAIRQALAALRYGGHASMLGIPSRPVEVDLADGVIFKGATIHGISGRRIWETWYQTRGFLESGMDLSPIITHIMPLGEFEQAFDLVASGQSGKVVMLPNAS